VERSAVTRDDRPLVTAGGFCAVNPARQVSFSDDVPAARLSPPLPIQRSDLRWGHMSRTVPPSPGPPTGAEEVPAVRIPPVSATVRVVPASFIPILRNGPRIAPARAADHPWRGSVSRIRGNARVSVRLQHQGAGNRTIRQARLRVERPE
jgi:hypothetical protein